MEERLGPYLDFYEGELLNHILPFWIENAIDYDNGGYFTCFTNSGDKLVSSDKFTWSQGRLIWVFAHLAQMYPEHDYLQLAEIGVDFVLKYAFLPNGNCVFLVDRSGFPKETAKGSGYDSSIYADAFVVLGLAKYAKVASNEEILQKAIDTYDRIMLRIESGLFPTEPYPIPLGYEVHGVHMIMLNTAQELSQSMAEFGHERTLEIRSQANVWLESIFSKFHRSGLIMEMVRDIPQVDCLLDRYVNPGHSIEDMWFVIHQALTTGKDEYIPRAVQVVKNMYKIGWDKEYGGLFLFVDKDGGKPSGSIIGYEDEPMVDKILGDWDYKLWWPHSEALYTTLLAYLLTKDTTLAELFTKTHSYVFRTFPTYDVGDWIQIRDRQGRPLDVVTALPVKDPFHIARNFILIIELLKYYLRHGDISGMFVQG